MGPSSHRTSRLRLIHSISLTNPTNSAMHDYSSANETNGFVELQIHRVSRNMLIWNGAALGVMAVIAALLWTYLANFIRGPIAVDDVYILNAAQKSGSGLIAYIELRDHRLIPTGYIEESTQDGRVYSTMSYYFVNVGNKKMLVKATKDAKGDRLLGPLQFYSAQTDRDALASINAKNPGLRDQVLPVMLNAAAAFNVFGYILLAIGTPLVALCLFNIALAILQGQTRWHPVMRSLARQGDPYEMMQLIDDEVADQSAEVLGKAVITRNWLLRPTAFRLIICRLDDIVWAYRAVVNADNLAAFGLRDGRIVGVPARRNAQDLLERICERIPWVEKGWDKEKARRWRAQRTDFLERVDSRRNAK